MSSRGDPQPWTSPSLHQLHFPSTSPSDALRSRRGEFHRSHGFAVPDRTERVSRAARRRAVRSQDQHARVDHLPISTRVSFHSGPWSEHRPNVSQTVVLRRSRAIPPTPPSERTLESDRWTRLQSTSTATCPLSELPLNSNAPKRTDHPEKCQPSHRAEYSERAPAEADARSRKLGGEDSNPQQMDQNHPCYQLHHPRRATPKGSGTIPARVGVVPTRAGATIECEGPTRVQRRADRRRNPMIRPMATPPVSRTNWSNDDDASVGDTWASSPTSWAMLSARNEW